MIPLQTFGLLGRNLSDLLINIMLESGMVVNSLCLYMEPVCVDISSQHPKWHVTCHMLLHHVKFVLGNATYSIRVQSEVLMMPLKQGKNFTTMVKLEV